MNQQRNDKTVGILGGMGPKATVDILQRIIRLTPAKDDIDHIRCLVDNDPKIPSRINAIIDQDPDADDPGAYIANMAIGLESAGADFLAMPCNTAHHYYDVIQDAVRIPLINLPAIVLEYLQKNHTLCKRVGILASPAIKITRLYEDELSTAGIQIVYPETTAQEALFGVIKAVKSGNVNTKVQQEYSQICDNLSAQQGVSIAIVACTELSAIGTNSSLQTIDAAEILAEKIVALAQSAVIL